MKWHTEIMKRVLIIAFIFFNLYSILAWGREGGEAESVFGFAESLFEEEDYFRAIGEYKRYMYLNPAEALAEKAAYRIAESYFKAKRWSESILACNQFLAKYPNSASLYEILYLKGRAEKLDKRYDEAVRTFNFIAKTHVPHYYDKALYQNALIMLERTEWQLARDFLKQISKESPLFLSASSFSTELERSDKLPHKSPTSAGILAAILPGAGHLYTERPTDAVVAFLLNGAFIWGAIELFRHDNYVAGSLFTFFELGWYTGNIYSAVSSAHKYNRSRQDEFIEKIKANFMLSFHQDKEISTFIVSRRF